MASAQDRSRGWQTTRTLTECHKYMLEHEVACDVTICFAKKRESEAMSAHRYILMCRSPVFEAMFSGGFQESDKIIIDDIEPDVFMQILRFMYCDEASITGHNVLHVMYAAKKYLLDGLVTRCSEFLEREISEENVCSILNHCLLYDEKALTEKSLAFIADHTKSVFESEDFLNLSQETLHQILCADVSCSPGPVDTFNSCVRWSKHQQTSDEDKSLREIIGRILYQIPFVQMNTKELVVCFRNVPDLLSDTEENALLKFVIDKDSRGKADVTALGFRVMFAKPVPALLTSDNRFNGISGSLYAFQKSLPNNINFQVSSCVVFHGVTLFGGDRAGATREVHLELFEGTDKLCTHDCTMEDTGTQEPIRVAVPEPVTLRQGALYTIRAGIDGPRTYDGDCGVSRLTTAGCTFTFHKTPGAAGDTNVQTGQIPQIIFSASQ